MELSLEGIAASLSSFKETAISYASWSGRQISRQWSNNLGPIAQKTAGVFRTYLGLGGVTLCVAAFMHRTSRNGRFAKSENKEHANIMRMTAIGLAILGASAIAVKGWQRAF